MDGQAILIVGLLGAIWVTGAETVKGVKWIGKKVDHAIFHRHNKAAPARPSPSSKTR